MKTVNNLLDASQFVKNYFNIRYSVPVDTSLPKKYIINKGATILFWKDGTKTIVKRNTEDEHNPRLAFLTAYFQKYSGFSKNKANKYLDNLIEEEEKNNVQTIKKTN